MFVFGHHEAGREYLNESPSKEEGKFRLSSQSIQVTHRASMKAPPRRKGNIKELNPRQVYLGTPQ